MTATRRIEKNEKKRTEMWLHRLLVRHDRTTSRLSPVYRLLKGLRGHVSPGGSLHLPQRLVLLFCFVFLPAARFSHRHHCVDYRLRSMNRDDWANLYEYGEQCEPPLLTWMKRLDYFLLFIKNCVIIFLHFFLTPFDKILIVKTEKQVFASSGYWLNGGKYPEGLFLRRASPFPVAKNYKIYWYP